MGRVKKLFNSDYLHRVPEQNIVVNEQNRIYIDRFVSEQYNRLSSKFTNIGCNINSSGFGSMDKLNKTILSLYTDSKLCFASWEEAKLYLMSKFTEKEVRIPIKKPIKESSNE